jgi:hypothetical protein
MRYWKKETMDLRIQDATKTNRSLSLFTTHSNIEVRACASTGSGRYNKTGICDGERKVNTVLALDWTGRGWIFGKEWGRVKGEG